MTLVIDALIHRALLLVLTFLVERIEAPPAADEVDALVVRDAEEPRPKRRPVAKLGGPIEREDERFLEHVLAVAWASRHARTEAVQVGAQRPARLLEPTLIVLHVHTTIGEPKRIRRFERIFGEGWLV